MRASLRTSIAPRTDTGLFVCQLRQLVALTQAQFAEKLGVSIPIARWENNRSQPSPLALMQLKAMLWELKDSPHKLQKNCAQALLVGYFDEK